MDVRFGTEIGAALCSIHPDSPLDAAGFHTISCVSTYKAMYESHDFMKLIYSKKSVEAGGEANIEPSTYKLLEDQLPADILRFAFP
jgi:hypothetical protein